MPKITQNIFGMPWMKPAMPNCLKDILEEDEEEEDAEMMALKPKAIQHRVSHAFGVSGRKLSFWRDVPVKLPPSMCQDSAGTAFHCTLGDQKVSFQLKLTILGLRVLKFWVL